MTHTVLLLCLLLCLIPLHFAYKTTPITEWTPTDVQSFFQDHFQDTYPFLEDDLQDLNGNDLLMLDDEDLETMGVDDAELRSEMLMKVQQYVAKVNHDDAHTSVDEYYLDEDRHLDKSKRRFDLEKLERERPRDFFAHYLAWVTSPAYSFLYFYLTDQSLLKHFLHLDKDYEFELLDYLYYTVLGRPMLMKRVYEMGYLDSAFFATVILLVVQGAYLISTVISIVARTYSPVGSVFPLLTGYISALYFVPDYFLSWKLYAPMLLFQSILTIPQAILGNKMRQLALKKKQMQLQKQKEEEAKSEAKESTAESVGDQSGETDQSADQSHSTAENNAQGEGANVASDLD